MGHAIKARGLLLSLRSRYPGIRLADLNWETVPGSRASRAEGSLPYVVRVSRDEQISSICRPVAGQMEIVAHRTAVPSDTRTFFAKSFVNQST